MSKPKPRTPRNRGKFSRAMDEYFAQLRAETRETVTAQQLQQCTIWCEAHDAGYVVHAAGCPVASGRTTWH